jgi:hypothetical protein
MKLYLPRHRLWRFVVVFLVCEASGLLALAAWDRLQPRYEAKATFAVWNVPDSQRLLTGEELLAAIDQTAARHAAHYRIVDEFQVSTEPRFSRSTLSTLRQPLFFKAEMRRIVTGEDPTGMKLLVVTASDPDEAVRQCAAAISTARDTLNKLQKRSEISYRKRWKQLAELGLAEARRAGDILRWQSISTNLRAEMLKAGWGGNDGEPIEVWRDAVVSKAPRTSDLKIHFCMVVFALLAGMASARSASTRSKMEPS